MTGPAPATGALRDGVHVLPVRVYFEDTDFTGVVYHGAFVRFLERGRTEALRAGGVDHRGLSAGRHGQPLHFAVQSLALRFAAPARIDEVLLVESAVARMTGARLVLSQRILREETVLVTAEVVLCLLDPGGRPRPLPDAVRAALS